jgi:hypothetical protein
MKTVSVTKYLCETCGLESTEELYIRQCEREHAESAGRVARTPVPERLLGSVQTYPAVGDIVWVDSGEDWDGGWGIVSRVAEFPGERPAVVVGVAGLPSVSFDWQSLEEAQADLWLRYGVQSVRRDP